MSALAKKIAADMPPPSAMGKSAPVDAGDGEELDESADQETTEESAAGELQGALNGGTPKDVASAFKKLMDICMEY